MSFITTALVSIIALWDSGYYSTFDPQAAREYLEAYLISKGAM